MSNEMDQIIAKERQELMMYMNNKIPLRSIDENIIIATWNIRKFGAMKESRAIQYIADIIERFDIIALQEVQSDLDGLKRLQQILPGNYKFLVSETTGNNERFAFLYDKRSVINTGYVTNLTIPVPASTHTGYQLHRIPYAASFKAGRFDFIIVTVHIFFGEGKIGQEERKEEILRLVDYIHKLSNRESTRAFDRDIFVVGDFNIPHYGDMFFEALTNKKFVMPSGMNQLNTNILEDKTFDKIAWVPRKSFMFNNNFGTVDFKDYVYKELPVDKLSDKMSDHLPVWAEFQIKKLEQELDAVLKLNL